MQLFKFFQPYRKYIKTAKNGGFCEELHSENNIETLLVNLCCYEYIIMPMLLMHELPAASSEAKISIAQAKVTAGVMPTH